MLAPPPVTCHAATRALAVVGAGGAIECFDLESSRLSWRAELAARALCLSPSGVVFVAGGDAPEVVALDSATGATVHRAAVDEPVRGLQLADETLLVLTDSAVIALDASSLAQRWALAAEVRALAASGGSVYALSSDSALVGLRRDDGSRVWTRRVAPQTLPFLAACTDGVALAVESVVVGYSAENGVRWVHSAPRRFSAGPVECGATSVAVADRGGVVRVLSARSGGHVASFSAAPLRPLALAASETAIATVGVEGDAWWTVHQPQP